jgi:hypothetical protein
MDQRIKCREVLKNILNLIKMTATVNQNLWHEGKVEISK